MDRIPPHIEKFITRDINYIVGGGIIVAAFLYAFGKLEPKNWDVISQLFAVGVSYMLGYAAQDIFSILRVVSTVPTPKPEPFLQRVYRRFTNEKWNNNIAAECELRKKEQQLSNGQFQKSELCHFEYERIVSLMHIGTTMEVAPPVVGIRPAVG